MLAHIKQDHDRLRHLADRLEDFLGQGALPHDPEFAQLRWRLVREVSMHLASERRAMARWKASGVGAKDDMDFALDDALNRHIVAWSGATMAMKWDGYCHDTRSLLERLRRRMDVEERSTFSTFAARGFA